MNVLSKSSRIIFTQELLKLLEEMGKWPSIECNMNHDRFSLDEILGKHGVCEFVKDCTKGILISIALVFMIRIIYEGMCVVVTNFKFNFPHYAWNPINSFNFHFSIYLREFPLHSQVYNMFPSTVKLLLTTLSRSGGCLV